MTLEHDASSWLFWAAAGLISALLLYVYHQQATQWRVVPKGFQWVPGGLTKRRMEDDFTARTKAHLSDFQRGTDFVMEGYAKVQHRLHSLRVVTNSFTAQQAGQAFRGALFRNLAA